MIGLFVPEVLHVGQVDYARLFSHPLNAEPLPTSARELVVPIPTFSSAPDHRRESAEVRRARR